MLTTLPPEYNSDDKRTHGHFELTLSAPVWTSDVTDVKQAHIRFWGHSSSNERVLEVPEEHGKTFLSVPITVGMDTRNLSTLDLNYKLASYHWTVQDLRSL